MAKWSLIRKEILDDPKVREEYNKIPSVQIAAQIINARKSKGLTQADLASLVGTSQSAIVRLEKGDYLGYSLRTLQKIAQALDATVEINFCLRAQKS
jgi:transcriptional regulator with XRE-family HTH domain